MAAYHECLEIEMPQIVMSRFNKLHKLVVENRDTKVDKHAQ